MKDVYLRPGDLYFSDEMVLVKTLLGSCIAITLWHPARGIGGMCHYKLPSSAMCDNGSHRGDYAIGAINIFMKHLRTHNAKPKEFVVGVYGGGQMFETSKGSINVSRTNIVAADCLLSQHGFAVGERRVGGRLIRWVSLELPSGKVVVKETQRAEPVA